MNIIFLGVVVAIAIVLFSIVQRRKQTAVIKELIANNNYQVFDYSKSMLPVIIVVSILSIVLSVFAFIEGTDTGIALSIVLLAMIITELFINRTMMKFYYNDSTCIVDEKLLRYKSIREFKPKGLSFQKQTEIITLNDERFTVRNNVAEIIRTKKQEMAETKATTDKKSKKKKNNKKKDETPAE